jgi:hypothetical protein
MIPNHCRNENKNKPAGHAATTVQPNNTLEHDDEGLNTA